MTKYLVKSTSTATENNSNFSGVTTTTYFGKGEKVCGQFGSEWGFDGMYKWMIMDYGYDRPSDAKRSWLYKNPQNDEYWTTTVEIVEVEV